MHGNPENSEQVSMRRHLEARFREKCGYAPDLDDPKTYLEKVTHRKLYDRNPLLTMACDKVSSREWARARIGDEYILPYAVFDRGQEWTTHKPSVAKHSASSGRVIFMPLGGDHTLVPGRWFTEDYGVRSGEWGYRGVAKRVLVEPLLDPWPEVYRFEMFAGVFGGLYIYRYPEHKRGTQDITVYDHDLYRREVSFNGRPIGSVPVSDKFETMLAAAVALSREWDYIRVDFLLSGERIAFSELTPYPMSGCARIEPHSWDQHLGAMWDYQPTGV